MERYNISFHRDLLVKSTKRNLIDNWPKTEAGCFMSNSNIFGYFRDRLFILEAEEYDIKMFANQIV